MTKTKDNPVKNISDIVGEWGKWQLNLTLFVFILQALIAYMDLSYSFHSYETKFWCDDVPKEFKNVSEYDQCKKFIDNNQQCDRWTYDRTEFESTIISEFNLVCSRSDYASISQSIYMFGYLLTGVVLSQFADKYGRKPLVWVSFVGLILSLISSGLSVNVVHYTISRFLVGLAMYGCSGAMCTSLLESCGPKHRSDIYMLAGFGWVFGYVLVPAMAFWLKDFRAMNYWIILPIIPTMIWFYFIHESPRWLITNGRVDKAKATLRSIIKQNGISDENFEQKFGEWQTHLLEAHAEEDSTKTYTPIDLLKTSNLRKYTVVFWYSWTAMGLVYYGFSLNMSDFGGNSYISFLLGGVVELPSSLISILVLRYMNRRMALIVFQVIIAVSSLSIIPVTNSILKVTLALTGKFAVGTLWWIYEVYVPEVYPTVLRNTGAGSASSFSRLGSMASPFMKNLAANTSLSVVMVLYAIISSIAGVLALFLPETKGTEIPDTLDEVERLNKK